MATAAQVIANQHNAQSSTGPRTAEGKANSATNSTRHGFRSQTVLLPGDNPAEYAALLQELTGHFEPVDLSEDRWVREMADAEWRLRKVRAMIQAVLTEQINALPADQDPYLRQAKGYEAARTNPIFRYEARFERQYDRAHRALETYRKQAPRIANEEIKQAIDCAVFGPLPGQQTNGPNFVPRNAPCPCGSGDKFKRCCGKNAPPVLNAA